MNSSPAQRIKHGFYADSETLGASGRPLYNVDSESGRFSCHWAIVPIPAFIFSSREVFYNMVFTKFDDTASWYLAACTEVNPRNTLARVNSIKTEAALLCTNAAVTLDLTVPFFSSH